VLLFKIRIAERERCQQKTGDELFGSAVNLTVQAKGLMIIKVKRRPDPFFFPVTINIKGPADVSPDNNTIKAGVIDLIFSEN